jgi:hypothetical protein
VPAAGRRARARPRARPRRRRDRAGRPRDEDDDKVELEAYLNVYARDNDRREAFLTCTVDFEGENRITDFDEDGLLRSINYYRDRGDNNRDRRRRDRDGDQRENARSACRELFETRATASRTSRIATGTTTTCGSRCGWSGGTAAASTRSASTTATATRPASPSCARPAITGADQAAAVATTRPMKGRWR